MSTRSSRRRWLGAALALPVLAGGLLFVWLAYTEHGLQRLAAWLESLQAVEIRMQGVRGRLAGPLQLDGLTLTTGTVSIRAEDVDLELDFPGLLLGRLTLGRLEAGSVQVDVRRASTPPEPGPPRFLPSWLTLHVSEVRIGQLDVDLPDGTPLGFRDVSASGSVSSSRIKLARAYVDAGAWTAAGSVTLRAKEPLALEGDLEWTVRSQPELAGTVRAKGDLARLNGRADLTRPSRATAEVVLKELTTRPEWEARVEADGFDLAPWMANPPVGPLAGFVSGGGTFQRFGFDAALSGRGLPAQGLLLAGRLAREGTTLVLDSARIATPDDATVVTAGGRLQFSGAPALQLQAEWQGLAWPLDGPPAVTSPSGRLEVQGWKALDFAGEADLSLQGVPATRVEVTGRADPAGIAVTHAALDGEAIEASASGYVGFGKQLPWQVEASVRHLDLGRFRDGLDSRLSFDASGSGLGFGPEGAWAAHLGRVGGTFRGHPATGGGWVVHERGRYRFEDVALEVGPARATLAGRLGGDTDLQAQIEVANLSRLWPEAGGTLDMKATLRPAPAALPGRPALHLDTSLRGRDLRWGEQRAAVLSADADIDLGGLDRSWARLRAAGLTVGGQAVSALRVSLDGLAGEHDFALRIGAGERAVDLVGSGRYDAGHYRLTADRFRSDAPALHPYRLEDPLQLAVSADEADLAQACFVNPPRRVCLAAHWRHAAGWSADLEVAALPLEALRLDLPRQPGYRGRLDFGAHFSQEGDAPWTAVASGSLQEAFLVYRTPSGRADEIDLGVTRLSLQSTAEQHELVVATEDSEALKLRARATLARAAGVALGDSPLQGTLSLATTRVGLLPLLVPEVDDARGSLRAELAAAGTPARPELGGTIQLDMDSIELYTTNLRLRDVDARFTLLDSGLQLESTGKAGDGTFRSTGELHWRDGVLHGGLRLAGERLLVADVPEARVEASPDLSFRIDGRDILLQGKVLVPKARIEPKQIVGAVMTSPDVRIVTGQEEEAAASRWRVRADVRLTLGKDVQLEAFGLQGRLEGNVLTQMRPEEVTTASGELEIRDGKYQAYTKELDVERGRLLFAGGPVTEPGVDLRASKSVPGYKVGVAVRGRLRRPEISLYSDPTMPQSQIASLLLVGRRLDNLDFGDRQSLGGSSGDVAAQGGAVLAGQLGRYIGIDEVSFETDAETDESELVIGKFLSPRLYVSYGISLSDAINTFKARYTIGDRWVISAEAGREASADVEFTIDR